MNAFKNIASVFNKNNKVKRQLLCQMKNAGMRRNFVKRLNFKFSPKMWQNCAKNYKKRGNGS
jgi:hypothetical protein